VDARITESFPVVPTCAPAQQCIESGHVTLKTPDSAGPAYGEVVVVVGTRDVVEVVVSTRDVVGMVVAGPDVVVTGALLVGKDALAGDPARCEDEEHPVALERVSMVTQTNAPTTVRLTRLVSFLRELLR
jgi:hypothetical protein